MKTNETLHIEMLNKSGIWIKVESGILNTSIMISKALDRAKKRYPDARVRAVGAITQTVYDMIS